MLFHQILHSKLNGYVKHSRDVISTKTVVSHKFYFNINLRGSSEASGSAPNVLLDQPQRSVATKIVRIAFLGHLLGFE